MSFVLNVLFAAVLLSTIAIMFWLPFAISRSLKRGGDYRQELGVRLQQVRHGSMLKALDIDVTKYLFETNLSDVHRQIKACNDCDKFEQCESSLNEEPVTLDKVSFCLNHKDLLTLKAAQDARISTAA